MNREYNFMSTNSKSFIVEAKNLDEAIKKAYKQVSNGYKGGFNICLL